MSQPAYNVPTNPYPKHPLLFLERGASTPCAEIGTDTYFYEPRNQYERDQQPALTKLCHSCPIYSECYDYALNVNVVGIWAGTTFAQRRRTRTVNGIVPHSMSMDEFTPPVAVRWDDEEGRVVAHA